MEKSIMVPKEEEEEKVTVMNLGWFN